MSTSEVADIRYPEYELPSILGENPSKDAIDALFGDYGYQWICKIVNKSNNVVRYLNPYKDEETGHNIAAGGEDSSDSVRGYLPKSDVGKAYQIYYFNKSEGRTAIHLTDTGIGSMLSFKQPKVGDKRECFQRKPPGMALVIDDNGYGIEYCAQGVAYTSSSLGTFC